MIDTIMGIEYGRGACAVPRDGGPALAPRMVRDMFPNKEWIFITPEPFNADELAADRFAENTKIQKKIYAATPRTRHILIGGDHSVNFGHFSALADAVGSDLCMIYIDAHLDIHTPESSRAQASGAPHGTNVRALLGDGDARWIKLQKNTPALKPENIFYLGTRSYERSEIDFAREQDIFIRTPDALITESDWRMVSDEIKSRLNGRLYVISFDFDAIDPKYFRDVWVPEANGITPQAAEFLMREFAPDAHSIEFVEYAPNGDASSAGIVQTLVGIAINEHAL